MLAPGKNNRSPPFVDVRDLAAFMIKVVEDKGPIRSMWPVRAERLTFARFIDEGEEGRSVPMQKKITWIDDYAFLTAQKA